MIKLFKKIFNLIKNVLLYLYSQLKEKPFNEEIKTPHIGETNKTFLVEEAIIKKKIKYYIYPSSSDFFTSEYIDSLYDEINTIQLKHEAKVKSIQLNTNITQNGEELFTQNVLIAHNNIIKKEGLKSALLKIHERYSVEGLNYIIMCVKVLIE